MAKLIFLRRTEKDVEVFGGDVYIDIDGKNVGFLTRVNQEFEITAGRHTVKMYKSHSYDTFIGFAESTFNVEENEQLMVRYAAPMAVNQPGNVIISAYDSSKELEALEVRESVIQRDYMAEERRKQEQNNKYNTGIIIFICFIIFDAIIWAIWMTSF